jgi:hypothetical protein
MPIYTFHDNKTDKIFTEMMSIAEMEEYLKKNPHIKQQITQINIVGGVSGVSYRSDGGWKDNLSRIAEAHPNSPLAQQHGKKSIKQVKTEQAIKKYKARRSAKNK